MLADLVRKNRSYRRFYEEKPVDESILREMVDLARLTPSGGNLQALKYMISTDAALNARIFPTLAWAGYLQEWPGPAAGERPGAYIVILGDTRLAKGTGCDHGIAAQTIMLAAAERGLGGCMIGSIERDKLRAVLEIPEQYNILLVLALGYPKETVVLEEVGADGSIRYYRDAEDVHHVPKRPLAEVLLN